MLDNVCKMTLYSYSFKHDAFHTKQEMDTQEVGLIAQEVQTIIPDAIHEMVNNNPAVAADHSLLSFRYYVTGFSGNK